MTNRHGEKTVMINMEADTCLKIKISATKIEKD